MDTRILYMTFKNFYGNKFSIAVNDPREDIEEQDIIDAMNRIVELNIFVPNDFEITETVSAKIVESSTTNYDLEI